MQGRRPSDRSCQTRAARRSLSNRVRRSPAASAQAVARSHGRRSARRGHADLSYVLRLAPVRICGGARDHQGTRHVCKRRGQIVGDARASPPRLSNGSTTSESDGASPEACVRQNHAPAPAPTITNTASTAATSRRTKRGDANLCRPASVSWRTRKTWIGRAMFFAVTSPRSSKLNASLSRSGYSSSSSAVPGYL
jgi:hypothetical protein